jgi:Domain of unknown function (DUF4439)
MSDAEELPALQRTLAAEHAAVYVFAVLGGRAAVLGESPLRPALVAAYDAHLARRNRLRVVVSAAGSDPVAAEPAYDVPRELTTPAQITAEALRVERACVSTYAALVAATTGAERAWAVDTLSAGALAELAFGGPPLPLPGLPAGFARG